MHYARVSANTIKIKMQSSSFHTALVRSASPLKHIERDDAPCF